jgi:hypothetical protein
MCVSATAQPIITPWAFTTMSGAAPHVLQLKTWTAGALACARENVAQARGPQRAAFARWGGGSPACASTGRLNLIRQ